MGWTDLFLNEQCIICGEKTPYYVCDKCREAILQVRERIFPLEEETIDSSVFIRGFFPKKCKKRKHNVNGT